MHEHDKITFTRSSNDKKYSKAHRKIKPLTPAANTPTESLGSRATENARPKTHFRWHRLHHICWNRKFILELYILILSYKCHRFLFKTHSKVNNIYNNYSFCRTVHVSINYVEDLAVLNWLQLPRQLFETEGKKIL